MNRATYIGIARGAAGSSCDCAAQGEICRSTGSGSQRSHLPSQTNTPKHTCHAQKETS